MALALLPIGINLYMWLGKGFSGMEVIQQLPRVMLCVLPIYLPLFWLAIFANKRVNLSKRLIEEYKHKETVSKTYEGLAQQISKIEDGKVSNELQARLLYNTVMLSEKNPGELIKNFNRPDNPLFDALNQSSRLAEAMEKLSRVPGINKICRTVEDIKKKKVQIESSVQTACEAVVSSESEK